MTKQRTVDQRIWIAGASARAAAMSAVRAGLEPAAADLFADMDLCALCPAVRVDRYPGQLIELARRAPPGPWLYTGALENHPRLVDKISAQRLLLGNGGKVLRRVRDPTAVAAALRSAGLKVPALAELDALPSGGRWLVKPRKSAGGRQIRFWSSGLAHRLRDRRRWYLQQFIAGQPCSAVYVAVAGRAVLLGVTQQLVGTAWLGASGFCYSGSLGPLALPAAARRALERIGNCLADRFGLLGLFGVDAVLADGTVWPVEVNPRYTASIEVLERAMSIDLLTLHVAACHEGRLPEEAPKPRRRQYAGKAIRYAERPLVVLPALEALAGRVNRTPLQPVLADLPPVGTVIQQGRPVVTLLADGPTPEAVQHKLRRLSRQLQSALADVAGVEPVSNRADMLD